MNSMKVHLYDFRWNDETTVEFQASAQEMFGKKTYKKDDKISLEILSEISCAGHKTNDTWKPCPEKAQRKSKCEVCKTIEQKDNFIFTMFDGFNENTITREEKEKLNEPHIIYLALFSEEMIKVGVSKKTRQILRQIEQGSYCTLYIGETPDGITARKIETIIKKKGYADKFLSSQKEDQIFLNIEDEQINQILTQEFQKIKEMFQEYKSLQKFLKETPEFKTWKDIYNTEEIKKNPHPVQFVSLETGDILSGKIKGIKGSIIIIETPNEQIAINAKQLCGRQINFEEKPESFQPKTAFQKALF